MLGLLNHVTQLVVNIRSIAQIVVKKVAEVRDSVQKRKLVTAESKTSNTRGRWSREKRMSWVLVGLKQRLRLLANSSQQRSIILKAAGDGASNTTSST